MSGNNGWFGMAPRPSTPTRCSTPTRFIQKSYSNSAPNSPSGLPRIERVPSQDAMDRAIHNDSGHGKSTIQIIKELKASNAKLCAKTAEMEAEFMNQVNEMTFKFNEREEILKKSLASKEKELSIFEKELKERDEQITQLKEESIFQRQLIADLKDQLYQLQHEIEDAEYDKADGSDKWSLERTEMEQEMEALRKKLKELTEENDSRNVMDSWKQLDATKVELAATKKRLNESQSALNSTEKRLKQIEKDFSEKENLLTIKESQLLDKVAYLEKHSTEPNLPDKLAEKEKIISNLKTEIQAYAVKVESLSAELADTKVQLENDATYRRDEAEDLRVLNDSLRGTIEHLKVDIDEMEREIDEKNEILFEKTQEIGELNAELERATKDLSSYKEKLLSLERTTKTSSESQAPKVEYESLEIKLHEALGKIETDRKEHDRLITEYEAKVLQLERDRLNSLAHIQSARLEEGQRKSISKGSQDHLGHDTSFEEKLRSIEIAFEKKLSEHMMGTSKSEDLLPLQSEIEKKSKEIELLRENLRLSELQSCQAVDHRIELESLKQEIHLLESKGAALDTVKKQLHEAQVALVALDEEKTLTEKRYQERIAAMERQISDLHQDFQAKLVRKDAELSQLHGAKEMLAEFETEVKNLKKEILEKNAILQELKSRSGSVGANGSLGDAVRKELLVARRTEEKLQFELSKAKVDFSELQGKMREKIADRDTTISTLVKSSVIQEQKMSGLKTEINALMEKLKDMESSPSEKNEQHTSKEIEYISEIENLRSALEDCKDVENRLLQNVSSLERSLASFKNENKRLRNNHSDPSYSRSLLLEHDEKIQERDSAIGNLVQQSMALEQQVTRLMSDNNMLRIEVESLRRGVKKTSGPLWSDIRKLQKESEIFASQIIDQDEELETLRAAVDERESRISILEKENSALKRKASSISRDSVKIDELQAELDELQEGSKTQRAELREMRKQLREATDKASEAKDIQAELEQAQYALEQLKSKAGSSAREDATLRRKLQLAERERSEIETKLKEEIDSIRREEKESIDRLEAKILDRDRLIKDLQSTDKVDALNSEIQRLNNLLKEKSTLLEESSNVINEMKRKLDNVCSIEELKSKNMQIEKLNREIQVLQDQLDGIRAEREETNNNMTRESLRIGTSEMEEIEANIIAQYEAKMQRLHQEHNVTVDRMRNELSEAKTIHAEHNEQAIRHIEKLEMESKDIKEELEAKLQLKSSKIHALEKSLKAQEQLFENMRAEMDQLQSSMERTSLGRRAEIEEMQQEMIDVSSKAQRQEREITALKMALEEAQLERNSEIEKLRERLNSAEKKSSTFEEAPTRPKSRDTRLDDVKERLENMKWRNTTLQEENVKLRKRLEKLEAEMESARSEQEKSEALESDNKALRKRVQELETTSNVNDLHVPFLTPQVVTPSVAENTGSRFGRIRRPITVSSNQDTSVRRIIQPSPLRFLKRKQALDLNTPESNKVTSDESSSNASKFTF
jgi:chromosome segregation ATPase